MIDTELMKEIRDAIQEVDDLFAWNLTDMEEDEVVARVAYFVEEYLKRSKAKE